MRAIMTYHSLDESRSVISIAPATFRRQMEWLATSPLQVLSLTALLRPTTNALPARDAVAITFDDGFENFAQYAAPVLRDLALPATLFIVSGRAGRDNRWLDVVDSAVPTLPLLDWASLARIKADGISIGAHTRRHPRLSGCSLDELEEEMVGANDDIRHALGEAPTTFAYPYGDVSDEACRMAARVYGVACTTELRVVGPGNVRERTPRLDMYYWRQEDRLTSWGRRGFQLGLRARHSVRTLRAAAGRLSLRSERRIS